MWYEEESYNGNSLRALNCNHLIEWSWKARSVGGTSNLVALTMDVLFGEK